MTMTTAETILENAFEQLEQHGAGPCLRGEQHGGWQIKGGMGLVEMCIIQDTEQVIKVPEPKYIRYFRNEVRVHSKLHLHDRGLVPELRYADAYSDAPYMVMEHLNADMLANIILCHKTSPQRIIQIFIDTAQALTQIHERGIIHKDIQPSNIAVRDDGTVVLLDLGVSLDQEIGKGNYIEKPGGTIMCTPAFSAPELKEDPDSLGPAYDQYSLGKIIHYATTDLTDWRCQTLPGYPGEIRDIYFRCIQENPSDRYPSCRHLADDLRGLL